MHTICSSVVYGMKRRKQANETEVRRISTVYGVARRRRRRRSSANRVLLVTAERNAVGGTAAVVSRY